MIFFRVDKFHNDHSLFIGTPTKLPGNAGFVAAAGSARAFVVLP